MERELVIGGLYRHFKGMLYYVKEVGIHSETGEKFVIYQQLYGELKTYIRPMDMFLSKVDKKKYPQVTQEFRFEFIEGK